MKDENDKKALVGARITRTFHVAKAGTTFEGGLGDVAKSAGGTDDNALLAYASVEVVDAAGDVVRIAGIDTSAYHNPPRSHLKIMAQHQQASPTTGETFVIGRVEEFLTTKVVVNGKPVPALAFRMSWASSDLAKKYRAMFDEGMLDSFSVGLTVGDYDPTDTGYDFTRTTLMEISAVSIPANPYANVLRRESPDERSDDPHATVKALEAAVAEQGDRLREMGDALARLAARLDGGAEGGGCELLREVEGLLQKHLAPVVAGLAAQDDRLDSIEAGIVVQSATPTAPKTDDRKEGQQAAKLAEISETLRRFAGR